MSWVVELQGERGNELRSIGVIDALERLLVRPIYFPKDFPYLAYLDPYGNTVFSSYQMQPFLAEWRTLYEHAESDSEREMLAVVEEIAEECSRTIHSYLKFIGD